MSPVKEVLVSAMLIILLAKVRDCSSRPDYSETKVDMRDLQNSSSCRYRVRPVVGYNKWLLKQLYHIECVNKGGQCPGTENNRNYTCLQTTKEILLDIDTSTRMILYTGCVCAYQVENTTSIFRTYN